jgi:hypothetical protein
MQDAPTPDELLESVVAFLRDTVIVEAQPRTAFQARVAASAIELVRRQLRLSAASDAEEVAQLRGLLGTEGALEELNTLIADALAAGTYDLSSPGLLAYLRAATLAKLAVDQPSYSGYRAAIGEVTGTPKDN